MAELGEIDPVCIGRLDKERTVYKQQPVTRISCVACRNCVIVGINEPMTERVAAEFRRAFCQPGQAVTIEPANP